MKALSSICAIVNPLRCPANPVCGSGRMQPSPSEGDAAQVRCRDCGAAMWSGGTEQFHVDGSSGLWRMMFGEPSDLEGAAMPLEIWSCPTCRRVEFRVPENPRAAGVGDRALRYACPGCGGDVYQGQNLCPSCGRVLQL